MPLKPDGSALVGHLPWNFSEGSSGSEMLDLPFKMNVCARLFYFTCHYCSRGNWNCESVLPNQKVLLKFCFTEDL